MENKKDMQTRHFADETRIPSWLLVINENAIETSDKGSSMWSSKRKSAATGFIKRTIKQVVSVFQTELLAERYALKNGLLQSLDPRVKLVSILLMMLFAAFAKGIVSLVLLGLMGYFLARFSRLSTGSYFRRVWLVIPLITIIISIPAATNLFIPGNPVKYFYSSAQGQASVTIYLTDNGLMAIIRMVLRIGVSISFGYLLIMTTRWRQITAALSSLHVPRLVISILDMTYRYIFVLTESALEMFEARYLRTVGKIISRQNRRFVSGAMALLFIKAGLMSEEVYYAMLCRGYDGQYFAQNRLKLTRNDLIWCINLFFMFLVLLAEEMIIG